ncbi:hypothetical protein ES705_45746 [subsurface metagenome]
MATKFENYDCGNTGFGLRPYAALYAAAQTFTPEVRHSLTILGVRIKKNGTPPAYYKIELRETTNHLPTLVILAEATFETAPITIDPGGEMKLVELDSLYVVEAGIEYAEVLIPVTDGDFNNTLFWYWQTLTNPYPRGDACSRSGGPWEQQISCDAGFEEWGEPAPPVGAMGKVRGFDFRGRGFRP